VVVSPLPVGPVTSTMPLGRWMILRMRSSTGPGMPSRSSVTTPPVWFRIRITTDSPCWVGMVEIRSSTWMFRTVATKRPSWGRRFSEMSRPDMSFRRSTSGAEIFDSASVWTYRTPSMRKRMKIRVSRGSMWMSEARTRSASPNTDCSSLTTCASSAPADVANVVKLTAASPTSSPSSCARPLIPSVRA